MADVTRRETMWAEMRPDVYDGPTCDQVKAQWHCYADGDKESEGGLAELDLSARTFPPGTKVIVSEPLCPKCGDLREPDTQAPEGKPMYAGPCRCGFDWDAWTLDQYS